MNGQVVEARNQEHGESEGNSSDVPFLCELSASKGKAEDSGREEVVGDMVRVGDVGVVDGSVRLETQFSQLLLPLFGLSFLQIVHF